MSLAEWADALRGTWKSWTSNEGVHHDYTASQKGPGHDLVYTPIAGGLKATAIGWGLGLEKGHFLILSHPNSDATSRYRIDEIRYLGNPHDMWDAKLSFWPRKVVGSTPSGDNRCRVCGREDCPRDHGP